MKTLEYQFNIISESFPNLSSFICYQRACAKVKPTKRTLRAGFRKMVEKDDYERRDIEKLLQHLEKTL
jgi:hypothetical protein